MRIGLDATYRVDEQPSGIAVYSEHILDGLAATHPEDHFLHGYRLKQFRRAGASRFSNVQKQVLWPWGRESQADVFHALNQRIDRRAGRRVVATFHDLFVMTGEYSSREFRERFARQAIEAARRADLIITVSEFTAGQVSGLLKVERSRIRVVRHGVETPERCEGSREPLILFVGALQLRKNVKRLVEAFESLPAPWRLVLAGATDGYRSGEILERVSASAARDRIEVTGYLSRQQLDDWYSRASVLAFPSLDEGFGMPVLEAMARGIPVVTSRSSALEEIATGAAILVDPLDRDSIAGALHRVTREGRLKKELAEAGRVRARQFSWQKSVDETYAVYCELQKT